MPVIVTSSASISSRPSPALQATERAEPSTATESTLSNPWDGGFELAWAPQPRQAKPSIVTSSVVIGGNGVSGVMTSAPPAFVASKAISCGPPTRLAPVIASRREQWSALQVPSSTSSAALTVHVAAAAGRGAIDPAAASNAAINTRR